MQCQSGRVGGGTNFHYHHQIKHLSLNTRCTTPRFRPGQAKYKVTSHKPRLATWDVSVSEVASLVLGYSLVLGRQMPIRPISPQSMPNRAKPPKNLPNTKKFPKLPKTRRETQHTKLKRTAKDHFCLIKFFYSQTIKFSGAITMVDKLPVSQQFQQHHTNLSIVFPTVQNNSKLHKSISQVSVSKFNVHILKFSRTI